MHSFNYFRTSTFHSSTVQVNLKRKIPSSSIDRCVQIQRCGLFCCRSPASVYVQMVPEIVPMKSLLTAFTTNKFGGRHILRASKSVPTSERRFINSCTSKTDITTVKHENQDWSDSSQDFTHLYWNYFLWQVLGFVFPLQKWKTSDYFKSSLFCQLGSLAMLWNKY